MKIKNTLFTHALYNLSTSILRMNAFQLLSKNTYISFIYTSAVLNYTILFIQYICMYVCTYMSVYVFMYIQIK